MDFGRLLQQLNDASNRWLSAVAGYFSDLSRNETYGWAAFCLGLVLFVVGLFLL